MFPFLPFPLSLVLSSVLLLTQTRTYTHHGNEEDNIGQPSLKYYTITTDYRAMASTWFTESEITTLTVCV